MMAMTRITRITPRPCILILNPVVVVIVVIEDVSETARSTSAQSASPASITHVDHALQESSWDALLLLGIVFSCSSSGLPVQDYA